MQRRSLPPGRPPPSPGGRARRAAPRTGGAREGAGSSWSAAATAAPPPPSTCGCCRTTVSTSCWSSPTRLRLLPDLQPRARRQPPARRPDHAVRRAAHAATASRSCATWSRVDRRRAARRSRSPAAPTIGYDKLVVSPGVDLMFDSVEGLRPAHAAASPACVESRARDRGAAPPARGDARRRRLRAHHSRGAVPLPARPVRARLPGRVRTSRTPSRAQGADPGRQPGCHVEGRRCSRRSGPSSTAAWSNTAPSTRLTAVDARRRAR